MLIKSIGVRLMRDLCKEETYLNCSLDYRQYIVYFQIISTRQFYPQSCWL